MLGVGLALTSVGASGIGEVSGAALLLAGESEGLGLSFTDDHFVGSGHYGSARVKDTGTPANNYNSHPFGLLNYGGPSVKWVRGPTGLWLPSDPDDDLPFEWDESANLLGIRIEEQRQSRALRSRRLDDETFWTATNITTSAVEGVDGVTGSATRITATDNGGTILGSTNTASSGARRLAPFIRRVAGTGNLEWTLDGGSTWTAFEEEITSSFQRIGVGATVANPRIGFRIASNGDAFDIDFANGEDGAFDTSPLESTDSHVTRAADDISLPTSAFPFANSDITMYVKYRRPHFINRGDIIKIKSGSAEMSFWNNAGATQVRQYYRNDDNSLLSNRILSSSLSVDQDIKVAGRFKTGDINGAVDGTVSLVDDTTAVNPTLLTSTSLYLGSDGGTGFFLCGHISEVMILPRGMTNTELQEITS